AEDLAERPARDDLRRERRLIGVPAGTEVVPRHRGVARRRALRAAARSKKNARDRQGKGEPPRVRAEATPPLRTQRPPGPRCPHSRVMAARGPICNGTAGGPPDPLRRSTDESPARTRDH